MASSTVETHRALLTDSIDADLAMHLYREGAGGMVQYVGLWGTWHRQDGDPTAVRVVLVTVVWQAGERPKTARLGDLAWVVLQLQTIHADRTSGGDENLWPGVRAALAAELGAAVPAGAAEAAKTGCAANPGFRISYDSRQQNERLRKFADEDVLQAYRILRVDDGSEEGGDACVPGGLRRPVPVRPAVSLDRERVCYRVHNVIEGRNVPAPVVVFLEKTVPRHKMLWQNLQREAGYVREGDLRAALGEAKTWIVLETDER